MASWLTSPQIGWISTLVVAMQLLFHPLAQPFTMATTRQGLKSFSISKVAHDLLRTVVDAGLLVHQPGWLWMPFCGFGIAVLSLAVGCSSGLRPR